MLKKGDGGLVDLFGLPCQSVRVDVDSALADSQQNATPQI
jgi:hypothetical protein